MANQDCELTRRQFLKRSAHGALAAAAVSSLPVSRTSTTTQSRPRTTAPAFGPGAAFARVVEIRHARVFRGSRISTRAMREMIDAAMQELTGQPTTEAAWRSLLDPKDVIGLKFNQVGDAALGTNLRFGGLLAGSLIKSGFSASRIVLIELPEAVTSELGTTPPKPGWRSETTGFNGAQDNLAAVLDQVSAIINVAAVKTHRIAGMAGALKNISHAMVRRPARYHGNGCDPWIASINALPEIRGKLRLHLGSAFRVVYETGPEATSANVTEARTLLASTDPVALDAVGWEILREVRKARGLPELMDPPARPRYLLTAERMDLGVADLDVIDRRTRKLA